MINVSTENYKIQRRRGRKALPFRKKYTKLCGGILKPNDKFLNCIRLIGTFRFSFAVRSSAVESREKECLRKGY